MNLKFTISEIYDIVAFYATYNLKGTEDRTFVVYADSARISSYYADLTSPENENDSGRKNIYT